MGTKTFFKKSLTGILAFAILFTQIVTSQVAYAMTASAQTIEVVPQSGTPNETTTIYDLVAVVVDSRLFNDRTVYPGLRGRFGGVLSESTFEGRVTRYVDDIVANNKLTDTKILFYDSTSETVVDVMKALENLYVNGDGSARNNKLRGVVLIGEIPLPVVNKDGNRFISMFPYTDFVDPAYIYNPVSGDFERNDKTALPKAEVWHGIIKAPTADVAGKEKLAEFFDKNHLYYEGVPEYANFDKKLFFGDMADEEKKENSELYKNYVKYLADLEDLAYQRYNKYWANELTGLGSGSATEEVLDSGVLTGEGADFLRGASDGGAADGMPDIFSKYIIDQTLVKYFQVFTKFISEINDWSDYTGRYKPQETDNIPGLISMKDEYTKAYLREANNALEKTVNELAEKIQEPIPILKYSKLSGTTSDGEPFEIKVGEKDFGGLGQDILVNAIAMRYGYYNEVSQKYYMNGVALDDLDSPKSCSVFLGSTKDNYFDLNGAFNPKREGVDGEYSILTRALRSDNPATAVAVHTVGVNTRLLAPDEAYAKTGGAYSSGALVEANEDYGVAAFEVNPLSRKTGKYANPLANFLKEGDLITKVDGENIDYAHTVENAVENAFKKVSDILALQDNSGNGVAARGEINFEYYRSTQKLTNKTTFTILSRKNPENEDFFVATNTALDNPAYNSDGAIFTRYLAFGKKDGEGDDGLGYADQGFDNSAGCNAGVTAQDSDKCFYQVASMPVLDPAGSTDLQMENGQLKFKNRTSTDRSTDVWQIPSGYDKEDIDQLYLDSCYDGLPSVAVDGFDGDSNPYGYPLDKTTKIGDQNDYHADFYGRWLSFVGNFVFPDGYKQEQLPSDNPLWFDLDNFDAGSVQLNQSPTITLNTFAARYGILDGVDNDGDGQVDEADEEDLNPLRSIGEIGRKLLSKNGFYRVKDAYGDYQTLDVQAVPYKTISSVILHNEPTYYTITQQLKSFGTQSLPIDNPRYVAFQNVNKGVSKIIYPNLFKTSNFLQMEANLDALAGQIALIPGSYKVMGGTGQYTLLEIKNKILNDYLKPPVHNVIDTPVDGIDLSAAATLKITDALKWLNLSIDDKHEYILTYYLNSKKNAYINDEGLGYEAAYLVFNGGEDGIISSFNKDLKEETAPLFDPMSDEYQENVQDEADQAGGDDDDDDGVEIWYWLDEELLPFIESFSNVTKDQECCSYAAEAGSGNDDDASGDDPQNELSSLKGKIDKNSFAAKSGQGVNFKVSGFNVDNQLVQSLGTEMVKINITQDDSAPILNLGGANEAPLIGGTATFKLSSTGNPGNAVISASSEDGLETASFAVTATSGNVDVVSMVYYAVEEEETTPTEETPPSEEEIIAPVEEESGSEGGTVEETTPPSEGGRTTTTEGTDNKIQRPAETGAGESGGDGTSDGDVGEVVKNEGGTTNETTPSSEVKTNDDGEVLEGRETWTDFFLRKQYQKKFFGQPWEEYFLQQKYPDKFESRAKRLLAAIPNDQNPFVDAETNTASKYVLEPSDEFVADGKTLMRVDAQMYASGGTLEKTTKKVKFRLESETASLPVFENGDTATSVNGVATIYLKAGTKTGKFKIRGQVLEENGSPDFAYPEFEKDLYLVAGDPYSISISADSYVLVANGQSHTKVNFTLKDKLGNVANNSYTDVAIFASDNGELDTKADLSSAMPGVQIGTTEGVGSVELYSKEQAGEVNVIAVLMDSELEEQFTVAGNDWKNIDFTKYIGNSKVFQVLDKVDLKLTLTSAQIAADGRAMTKLRSEMLHDNEVVSQYNGPIEVSVLNDSFLTLNSAVPEKMISGKLHEENVKLRSTTTAGTAEVLVNVPGFISKTVTVTTLPGPAKRIELTSSAETLYTEGDNEIILEARLLDTHGNLVTTDNSTRINFATTPATDGMINFVGAQTAVALKGVASAKIKGGERSGFVNITAKSPNLKVGTVSLEVKKLISPDKAEQFAPRALFVSVLGGAYSDVAQRLLHSGEAEAVSTVTASAGDSKRLIYADGFGKVQAMTDEFETKVVSATLTFPYQKIIFSDGAKGEELAAFFIVPNTSSRVSLVPADQAIADDDGIYVRPLDDSFEYVEKNGGVLIQSSGKTVAKIDKFGRINISNKEITIDLPNKEEKDISALKGLSFVLLNKGNVFGVVNFKQSQDVSGLTFDNAATSFRPGIYLKMLTPDSRYDMISALSGNASDDPKGIYLIDRDNTLEGAQTPGFGYTSLENAGQASGVGFEGDNKQMLLFAAGNSVGESSLPYASEVGLIYGDPMVKVKKTGVLGIISTMTGYTRDIGQAIFSDSEDIQEMVKFDYNGDGRKDLLLVYESGMIRLLENVISNRHYEDRGYILNVYGGIYSAERIDANNDGYDDLLVGTKESCVEGEQCMSLFMNDGGSLERETLNLAISDKAFEMKVDDLNADGCEDLVVSDSSGNVRAFYNKNDGSNCAGLNTNYGFSKNFGISVDAQANLSDNLFANYNGMEQLDDGYDSTNADKFIRLTVPSSTPPSESQARGFAEQGDSVQDLILNKGDFAEKDVPPQSYGKEFLFINLPKDDRMSASVKTSTDANGGSLALEDQIDYKITLKNTGGAINGLMLSDATGASMSVMTESLQCLDVGCSDDLEFVETGVSARAYVIKNISVPARGTRTIQYSVKVENLPEVHIETGKKLTDYPSHDGDQYTDILVRPAINPEGVLSYFYSTGLNSDGTVNYQLFQQQPTGGKGQLIKDKFEEAGLPDPGVLTQMANALQNLADQFGLSDLEIGEDPGLSDAEMELLAEQAKNTVPDEVKDSTQDAYNNQTQDANYDGCPDSYGNGFNYSGEVDLSGGLAGNVADGVEGAMSLLRCSGAGCLPIPYNYAFLVPDFAIPGLAFFATLVRPPFVASFYSSTASDSNFRFYISPTLTAGLGFAACAGPGAPWPLNLAPCWAFAAPLQATGVCPDFSGAINDAVSQAQEYTNDEAGDTSGLFSDGQENANSTDTTTGNVNFFDEDDPLFASATANLRIPGFPSFLTDWMDKQTDEIYNKLLDLPDLYVIYPDFGTLADQTAESFSNFDK
ncbi:MAG: VCBS repeat-containing protein, partial [Candidatus Gracilibacteria bacterium]